MDIRKIEDITLKYLNACRSIVLFRDIKSRFAYIAIILFINSVFVSFSFGDSLDINNSTLMSNDSISNLAVKLNDVEIPYDTISNINELDAEMLNNDHDVKANGASIVTLMISLLALLSTIAITYFNFRNTQHKTRPIVSVLIDEKYKINKETLAISVQNLSKTDAEGLVYLEITYNDTKISCPDSAYYGGQVWSFPAKQTINGAKNLKNITPEGMTFRDVPLAVEFKVYYRAWKRKRRLFKTGKIYDAPAEKWKYYDGMWIPDITFSKSLDVQTDHAFKEAFKKYTLGKL